MAHQQINRGSVVTDWMNELREIGELRDSGILSDEEFEAEKARLLQRSRDEATNKPTEQLSSSPPRAPQGLSVESRMAIQQAAADPSCELCGARPAAEITLRRLTGAVILFSSYRSNPILCASCGELATTEMQKQTLTKGWWSATAAVLNPVVVATNSNNKRKHQKRLRNGGY
jgi:hypothetical protein